MNDFCAIRSLITDLQAAEDRFSRLMGLTLAQASMLCAVHHGLCEPRQLQEELKLTPSRVTRLADSLEKKGLLERLPASDDRRSVMLRLTPDGKDKIESTANCRIALPEDIDRLLDIRAKERTW